MNTICDGTRTYVRDSHGTAIELRDDVWADVIGAIHIQPTHWGVEWEGVPPHTGNQTVLLRFTDVEWATFLADVRAGGFDYTLLDAA